MPDEALVNKYHKFLVNLAFDDENDPMEAANGFLQGISLPRRIECMRYWLSEYENGQLETVHRYRYENDSFMWKPGTPIEEMDSQGIIDATMDKLKLLLEVDVPAWLIKAEEQYHGLAPESSSHLQQAKDILRASEEKSPSVPVSIEPKPTPAKKPKLLHHKQAALFLGWSESKLYKFKGLARRHEGRGNLRYLEEDLVALLESLEKGEKPTFNANDAPPESPSNITISRVGRGRKRRMDDREV